MAYATMLKRNYATTGILLCYLLISLDHVASSQDVKKTKYVLVKLGNTNWLQNIDNDMIGIS